MPLYGRPLVAWTLDALSPIPFARTVIAVPAGREAELAALARNARVIAGGETRAASVRRAFEVLDAQPGDVVCVHDAARPLVAATEVARVLEAAARDGAAIAAIPIPDTVKKVAAGRVAATLDRDSLWSAATPQAARADLLRRALGASGDATDEASLLERIGVTVSVVPVSRLSFKITTPEDLELAEAILRSRNRDSGRLGTGFSLSPDDR